MLALAGAEIPERLQGQVFLGDKRAKAREYAYAAADRMDNAVDRIRAVRDDRRHSREIRDLSTSYNGKPYVADRHFLKDVVIKKSDPN